MSQTTFTGKVSQMKPDARWLASEDFIGLGEVELEISGVYQNTSETMQDGKKKDFFSMGFSKTHKQLVLNATNRKTLSAAFGAKVERWVGQKVRLFAQDGVKAIGGGTTTGLRLKADRIPRDGPIDPFAKVAMWDADLEQEDAPE
jgi:hypothetical protein